MFSKRENIGKQFAEEKPFGGNKISRGRKYQSYWRDNMVSNQNIVTFKNTTTIYPSTSSAQQLLHLNWVY